MKKLELSGKQFLNWLLPLLFRRKDNESINLNKIRKILVLRLDQRIGNGILLLPLLHAIKKCRPDVELHLLLHYPVAELINKFSPGLVNTIWGYRQKKLLTNPIKFICWLNGLRHEKYDLVISSHNPDNFSLSQAILGRWCNPDILAGFRWKDSPHYYDIAISSSVEKHYSDAQLDLWRYFDSGAELQWGGLKVPENIVKSSFQKWNIVLENPCALLWLGATGDKVLPADLISFLYEQIRKQTVLKVKLALGPSDRNILKEYPDWVQQRAIIWQRSLIETAEFFSGFKLFVSGDTGPMHLAAALGLPTFSIFNQSKINQYGYNDGILHFSMQYTGQQKEWNMIVESLKKLGRILKDED